MPVISIGNATARWRFGLQSPRALCGGSGFADRRWGHRFESAALARGRRIGQGAVNSLAVAVVQAIVLAAPMSIEEAAAGYLAETLWTVPVRFCSGQCAA
jgi:hypothetical protein